MFRIILLCFLLTGTGWCKTGDTLCYLLHDTIMVTGSRIPARITEATRSVSAINKEMIESLPIHDMDDLLKISAVEVNERSMGNVQADLSIRGSTFNQVSVFWDDININDPQTGHFYANIPAPFSAVEKVEVISGGNSALFGAQAFGGIIRFIPEKFETTGFKGYFQHGSFNTQRTGADIGGKSGKINYGNYFEYQRSDGMIKQLDYEILNNFIYGQMDFMRSSHKIGVGIQKKSLVPSIFMLPIIPSKKIQVCCYM